MSSTGAVQPAKRLPPIAASLLSLAGAGLLGSAACADDVQLLALGATLVALVLLVPALRTNRATLPAALVVGAVPAVLSLRAQSFPRYDVAFVGVLLVAAAECANRARYVRSTAPRGPFGHWLGSLLGLLATGALATGAAMAAGNARLDGAVVLTVLGAAALAVTGLAVARAAHR